MLTDPNADRRRNLIVVVSALIAYTVVYSAVCFVIEAPDNAANMALWIVLGVGVYVGVRRVQASRDVR